MNGNFTRLNLNGDVLKVEGWLSWDIAVDDSAVLVVTVTQGTNSVTSEPINVGTRNDKWEAPVPADIFEKGVVAAGQAGATVTLKNGSTVPQNWTSNPLKVE